MKTPEEVIQWLVKEKGCTTRRGGGAYWSSFTFINHELGGDCAIARLKDGAKRLTLYPHFPREWRAEVEQMSQKQPT